MRWEFAPGPALGPVGLEMGLELGYGPSAGLAGSARAQRARLEA